MTRVCNVEPENVHTVVSAAVVMLTVTNARAVVTLNSCRVQPNCKAVTHRFRRVTKERNLLRQCSQQQPYIGGSSSWE
jgi:hypothetical protein